MADKNIEIGIRATGAAEAAREIRRVDDAVDQASISLNSSTGLAGAAVVAQQGMQQFETQAGRVSIAGNQMRSTISNVGYQIQDFAVQTASGTSAVRAFSQQAPQLLSAFGPWGIVAGTAVAVAAPLITSLFQIGEAASEAEVKIEDMADAIAEANRRLIDGLTEGISQQIKEQKLLRDDIAAVAAAERNAAASTLSNDEKLRQSKIAIAEALGLQIDRYREIESIAAAEAEQRRLKAEQAVAVEREQLEKARIARQDAEAAVALERQKQAEAQALRDQTEAELAQARQEKAALQAVANRDNGLFDFVGRSESRTARRQLANPRLEQTIAELENRVAQIDEDLDKFEGPSGSLREVNVKLQKAINDQTAKAQEVEINVASLEASFAQDDLAARTKTLADLQVQQASELKAAVSNIEVSTETGKAAKATIEKAAADGIITANEIDAVARASVALQGQLQAGLATTKGNIDDLINFSARFAQQSAAQSASIKDLARRVADLER